MMSLGVIDKYNRMDISSKGGLAPIISGWTSGRSYQEALLLGYDQARAILAKYTTTLMYDADSAKDLFHQVEAWQSIHTLEIEEMMKHPGTDTVPEQLALKFSPHKAQQFIIASFSSAARGLGPWFGGMIGKKIDYDPRVTQDFAKNDAMSRLAVFAGIVKLDGDGSLRTIFNPPAALQGFGALPAVAVGYGAWLLVAAVAAIAVVLVFVYFTRSNDANNKLMAELCKEAQSVGDKDTVGYCLKLTADLQNVSGSVVNDIVKYVAIGGALYIGVVYVLIPQLNKRKVAT